MTLERFPRHSVPFARPEERPVPESDENGESAGRRDR